MKKASLKQRPRRRTGDDDRKAASMKTEECCKPQRLLKIYPIMQFVELPLECPKTSENALIKRQAVIVFIGLRREKRTVVHYCIVVYTYYDIYF